MEQPIVSQETSVNDGKRETITRTTGNKGGKLSRNKRKNGRKGSPISLFVKGQISGEQYFKLTGQSTKRNN